MFVWTYTILCLAAFALNWMETMGKVETVPLNPLCTVFDDIERVEHDIEQRRVSIVLKESRRCMNPNFVVRLSGTGLVKVPSTKTSWGQMFTYRPLIDAGVYFLEITVIYCHGFRPNSPHYNCVENVHYGRNILTQPYSFESPGNVSEKSYPRWVHRKTQSAIAPVPTRHQMLKAETPDGLSCSRYCKPDPAHLEPYNRYEWVGGHDWQVPLRAVYTQLTTPRAQIKARTADKKGGNRYLINICYVGDSHSRVLQGHLLATVGAEDMIASVYVFGLFAPQFKIEWFEKYHCSIAVISYGQWALTRSPVFHTQDIQEAHMGGLIEQIKAYQGPTRVFLRSENYNGLGYPLIICPPLVEPIMYTPKDRRTPPAFDMMNNVTRTLSARARVPFIDMLDIIGPMWDAALDFSHPSENVLQAENNRILYKVFTYILQHRLPVRTFRASELPLRFVPPVKPSHDVFNRLVAELTKTVFKDDLCPRDNIL